MKYRDTKTGRFVSATTWKRSRAHGGKRYRRVVVTRTARPRETGTVRPATSPVANIPEGGITSFGGTFVENRKVPQEFLDFADFEFFEAGYEADEEDEY